VSNRNTQEVWTASAYIYKHPLIVDMGDAQARIDAWVAAGDLDEPLTISNQFGLTELPPLPEGLRILNCTNNFMLRQLSPLPSTLQELTCSANKLTELPELPDSLVYLSCGAQPLTSLPSLPPNLQTLSCLRANLTTLPPLPQSLTYLDCRFNKLTELPPLEHIQGYITIYVGRNRITELPPLPSRIIYLDCAANRLTTLPPLPPTLQHLYCGENAITVLPPLPPGLIVLECNFNRITMIPRLPPTINNLDINLNPLHPIFKSLYTSLYQQNRPEFFRQLNHIHDLLDEYSTIGRARGRNRIALELSRASRHNVNTPANWYGGPNRATALAMNVPNIQSHIGSFLTGYTGSLANQGQILRAGPLRTKELLSREFGKPGVGNTRRRKNRRARSRRNRR
jgi:hypothetical protein